MLNGDLGPGPAMAMRVVLGLARVRGARRLVEISSAHIDSCLFHGRAGLDFAERLAELGARTRVPRLGARATWTCAPYQLDARPGLGEHIAWAESNAIVFANSVLGARTDRYGDFLDRRRWGRRPPPPGVSRCSTRWG